MALRPPSRHASSDLLGGAPAGALSPIDHELVGEMAASLGRAGARVETSLKRLAEAESGTQQRAMLLKEAADAVYAYLIQREVCGLRRHDDVVRDYRIPREVVARLGAS